MGSHGVSFQPPLLAGTRPSAGVASFEPDRSAQLHVLEPALVAGCPECVLKPGSAIVTCFICNCHFPMPGI